MPEKLHRCVNNVKGDGKSTDSSWAICNSSLKELEDMVNHSTDAPKAREHNGHFSKPRGNIHEGGGGGGLKPTAPIATEIHEGGGGGGLKPAGLRGFTKETRDRSLDEIIND